VSLGRLASLPWVCGFTKNPKRCCDAAAYSIDPHFIFSICLVRVLQSANCNCLFGSCFLAFCCDTVDAGVRWWGATVKGGVWSGVQLCECVTRWVKCFSIFFPFLIFQYSDQNVKFIHVGMQTTNDAKCGDPIFFNLTFFLLCSICSNALLAQNFRKKNEYILIIEDTVPGCYCWLLASSSSGLQVFASDLTPSVVISKLCFLCIETKHLYTKVLYNYFWTNAIPFIIGKTHLRTLEWSASLWMHLIKQYR